MFLHEIYKLFHKNSFQNYQNHKKGRQVLTPAKFYYLKTGLTVACCVILAQCSKNKAATKASEPVKLVKCGEETEVKPDRPKSELHASREDDEEFFVGKGESATRTGYCVNIPTRDLKDTGRTSITNFGWKLFKHSNSQPNYVISPMTPQILLGYLGWLAEGDTRKEIVDAIGYGHPNIMQRLVDNILRDNKKREIQIASAFFVADSIA